jgi:hypothetical protein
MVIWDVYFSRVRPGKKLGRRETARDSAQVDRQRRLGCSATFTSNIIINIARQTTDRIDASSMRSLVPSVTLDQIEVIEKLARIQSCRAGRLAAGCWCHNPDRHAWLIDGHVLGVVVSNANWARLTDP